MSTDTAIFEVLSPLIPDFDLIDSIACLNESNIPLSGGTPSGGNYSGPGVSGGVFNASAVGIGTHPIFYNYTDGNGCIGTAIDSFEVVDIPNVTLNIPTDNVCVTETNVPLTGENLTGGIFSGPGVSGNNFDPSAAGPGTHTITYAYSDGTCSNSATDIINVSDEPVINLVTSNDPTTCGGDDGDIQVSASGGSTSLQYRLNGGLWQYSSFFANLTRGDYILEVRNDNGQCILPYVQNPIVIHDPSSANTTTEVLSNYLGEDISCVGEMDGLGLVRAVGGQAPYSYVWSNGQLGDTLRNVGAGEYYVTVTDDLNCGQVDTLILNDPPALGASATFTHISCYGGFDGTIDVTATGGVGAYTYAWSDIEPEAFYAFDGTTDDITGNDHHAQYNPFGIQYNSDAIDGDFSAEFNNTYIGYDDDVSFLETSFAERSVLMWIKPNYGGIQVLYDEGGIQGGISLRLNGMTLQGAISHNGFRYRSFDINLPNSSRNWLNCICCFEKRVI